MGLKDKIERAIFLRWLRGKAQDWRKNEGAMKKVLELLDGWKLVIVAVVIFGSRVYDAANNGHTGDFIGAILAALGWAPTVVDPVAIGAAATGALAVWGVFSRIYKAQQQYRAGATPSELLSLPGYVKLGLSDKHLADMRVRMALMEAPRPTIPVGDILQNVNLPGWLRWILNIFRGVKITAGPVDIQLDQKPGAFPAGQSPLDSTPHKPAAPPIGMGQKPGR